MCEKNLNFFMFSFNNDDSSLFFQYLYIKQTQAALNEGVEWWNGLKEYSTMATKNPNRHRINAKKI